MEQNIIVFESCGNLRALARNSLRGKWGLAALATLLYSVLAILPVFILDGIFGDFEPTGVSSVYSMLIAGPLTLGYAMFAISLFRGRKTSPTMVFYGFERFGKAFGLYIVMSIFVLLWSLLLFIPGIIAALRYSLCFYILADNPNMGIMQALNESKRMMKGNKWKLFCLILSFIGWMILGLFTLGIGYLWLMPYIEVTMIAFYDIANGSLRPAQRNDWQANYDRPESDVTRFADPITVYRDGDSSGDAATAIETPKDETAPDRNDDGELK